MSSKLDSEKLGYTIQFPFGNKIHALSGIKDTEIKIPLSFYNIGIYKVIPVDEVNARLELQDIETNEIIDLKCNHNFWAPTKEEAEALLEESENNVRMGPVIYIGEIEKKNNEIPYILINMKGNNIRIPALGNTEITIPSFDSRDVEPHKYRIHILGNYFGAIEQLY